MDRLLRRFRRYLPLIMSLAVLAWILAIIVAITVNPVAN
jgi:hypothetical protein